MRDTSNEGFPAVLVEPWVVGTCAIGLDVEEARDGRKRNPRIEQWPSIRRLEPIGIRLVDIDLEERPSGSE